ncbi:hypothetical protein LQ954_15150 [Sphingomonas sp. IC-11]|uniref:hypothetical protein n=1 Tax=Sphingomonas sp. IC-11 TaxID=2898528 RepID=UPI001E489E1E|nr:hypothetical protein [Sphingomonas sp. IC-11]MCD2317484.1 hypothetical protein [Sphingomonas sp. IC-11]
MRTALRHAALACLLLLAPAASVLRAETTAFDLAGPSLRVLVTHGDITLPLSQVPNLSAGDRIRVVADLPAEQSAQYRMVLAFLRGATNPPPKDWLAEARTWKPKEATIDVRVPEGAQQALIFLVPETGGAIDGVAKAVREQPGAFVRASQELNQAMLDRTRLETFLDQVRRREPAEVARISPQLADSLAIKLDSACLLRQPDPRAACLAQSGNAAVLADSQTSSIAQTLAGAPANIALQLSATPQGGFGYYSGYIGVVRDLARMLGAFQSAQLRFIPALGVPREGRMELLLNTVPSFRKPQSVLVAALPTVAPPILPVLSVKDIGPRCLTAPTLTLPVGGAPLVFSTGYARAMTLRVPTAAGTTLDLPVTANPAAGGFVVGDVGTPPVTLAEGAEARLQGFWGFQPFDGPRFRLASPAQDAWRADGATLVVGRDTPLTLSGGAAACVAQVWLERDGEQRAVAWNAEANGTLSLKVPLAGIEPGPVALLIRSHGMDRPRRLDLRAYAEASRITGFTLHAGDRTGMLAGTRLDQVKVLEIGAVIFEAAKLGREGTADRLEMAAESAAEQLKPGELTGRATLADGRTVRVPVRILPARPRSTPISTSLERVGPAAAVPLTLADAGLVPQDARLTFSLRAAGSTRFAAGDRIEVEAIETGASTQLPIRLQDDRVAIATLDPASALGESARGPLRFRLVQGDVVGDWQPLATLVRLPRLSSISCAADNNTCTLAGTGLFLISRITGAADAVVPDGFTGSTLQVPRPADGKLRLYLRDAPGAAATVDVPAAAAASRNKVQ